METEIQNYIKYYAYTYMRELLGETVYILLSMVLLLVGIVLLIIAISDSNAILGNPLYRDRSSLNDLEYKKTRQKLRITLGVVGLLLIVYNLFGFF